MKIQPIKITDTSLRDGQQSMWAPYISLDDLKTLIKELDQIGFHSLDVWGGGTFEACLKFWDEDPWERLETIKKYAKNTPLQMVIRAKSIVGYHHYANDLLEAFIKKSIDKGISIIRIFDPLNDVNNLKEAISYTKKYKAHAQGTLCYTIAPKATVQYFTNFAKKLKQMGADSIAIKDAAGLLTPDVAIELIQKIKKETNLPIQLHSHLTSGLINITYYEAIKHNVDIIDCSLAPFSLPAAQPAAETILTVFDKTPYKPNLNQSKLYKVSSKLSEICKSKEPEKTILPLNDYSMFKHQLPRGAYIFLYKQLLKRNAVDKMQDVLKEIPRVRKDLGNPPLYVPINIFIVAQSVYNVLMKTRYKLIPREIKEYVNGAYGKAPEKIDKVILDKIKSKKSNAIDTDITEKPLFSLKNAYNNLNKKFVKKETDYLTYALFPELAVEFFMWRENPDKEKHKQPLETKDISPEEELLLLNKLMDEKDVNEFEFSQNENYIYIQKTSPENAPGISHVYNTAHTLHTPPQIQTPVPVEKKGEPSKEGSETNENIPSPIVGVFYAQPAPSEPAYVKTGDKVNEGQTVCIIEAMKVMNEIKAPYSCEITKINVKDKDSIQPGQALFNVKKI